MRIIDLLNKLKSLGIQLQLKDGRLTFAAAKGAMTPEIKNEIVSRKQEIIDFLSTAEETQKPAKHIPEITPTDRNRPLPLSFAQQRIWFLEQFEPGSSSYNIPSALRFSGSLNIAALEKSLNNIIQRHEVLRTAFFENENQIPQQIIKEHKDIHLDIQDISSSASPIETAIKIAAQHAKTPFNLAQAPLIKAVLLYLGDNDHVLLLNIHHIVSDGWSMGIFIGELVNGYTNEVEAQKADLPPLEIQYGDFSNWQREWISGEVLNSQISYWKEKLSDAPSIIELPTDRKRPTIVTSNGAVYRFNISKQFHESLQEISKQNETTLFMSAIASFQILLMKLSGQNDICVGTPIANRNNKQVEKLIGFFVNTLVMRNASSENETFVEFLKSVKSNALNAYANQDVPFEQLVDEINPQRDMSHTPLFQVMFALQNMPSGSQKLPGLDISPIQSDGKNAKFDLYLSLAESSDGLVGAFEFNTDLYNLSTIEKFAEYYINVLEAIIKNPDSRISEIKLLSDEEKVQVLENWNNTSSPYPAVASLKQLFEDQVLKTPDNDAVIFDGKSISYSQLNSESNKWAHYFIDKGVNTDELVGICIDRSIEMISVILGIIKAGGAYLPIDPDYPQDRISYMLQDADAKIVIASDDILDSYIESSHSLENSCENITTITQLSSVDLTQYQDTNPDISISSENLAYVNYTSGSTGIPKGIAIVHKAVSRLVLETNYVTFDENDTLGQIASPSFDAFTFELWGAVLNGGRVCIIPKVAEMLPEEFAKVLEENCVTTMFMTSALFTYYAQKLPTAFKHMKTLSVGGDKVDPHAIQAVIKAESPERIVNGYGPTENTTFSTWYPLHTLDKSETTCPIGYPIGNSTTFVLDKEMNPVPPGVVGELHVGGDGLARCYINRPDQTAEKFVPNPFTKKPGERLYKTGDLVRFRPKSTNDNSPAAIEFVGRVDNQVKVRGFRIELGEIEAQISNLDGISATTVLVREDTPGDKRIVAYLVAESEEVPLTDLRTNLSQLLPDFMVPSAFVWLDNFPLTPNGKVDRKKLPAPDQSQLLNEEYVEPRDDLEKSICDIWKEVLGVSQVGIYDNFFDLGGNSLLATQLVSKIRVAINCDLAIKTLFENANIEKLCKSIQGNISSNEESVIEKAPIDVNVPASFAQQRLWFLDKLHPGDISYNIPAAVRLQGDLNFEALKKSLNIIIQRHEGLRTTFATIDDKPIQIINNTKEFDIREIDLSSENVLSDPIIESQKIIQKDFLTPFDLEKGPLFRGILIKISNDDSIFALNMHHIISDGWSVGVLLKELVDIYSAEIENRPHDLPALKIQYRDFSYWQRNWLSGDTLNKQIDYWKNTLEGAPDVIDLPTDFPRGKDQSSDGDTFNFLWDKELSSKIEAYSNSLGLTPFMTLLTIFNVLLSKYSNQDDICVGTPIANRNRPEIESIIGFFVNTLVLRTKIDANKSFHELLLEVKSNSLEAYAHQDLPFEQLVDELKPNRSTSHTPLFQVLFSLQNLPTESRTLPGIKISPIESKSNLSKFDLKLNFMQQANGLSGIFNYKTGLFKKETIEQMASHLKNLATQFITNPQIKICESTLLSDNEKKDIISEFSLGKRTELSNKLVIDLFEENAKDKPDSIALVCGNKSLTYKELNNRANAIAIQLIDSGVKPNSLVVLLTERSVEMIIGLLAILKSGGCYVPVDPIFPEERINHILKDADPVIALTTSDISSKLNGYKSIDIDKVETATDIENPQTLVSADNRVYTIYTSGSTGVPKAASVYHKGLSNLINWYSNEFKFNDDKVLIISSISFDLTQRNIFGALCNGSELHLIDTPYYEPNKIVENINSQKITFMCCAPSAFYPLLEEDAVEQKIASLKQIVLGGEAMNTSRLNHPAITSNNINISNAYGPTETTATATCYHLTQEDILQEKVVPIGNPIDNVSVYILDKEQRVLPTGIVGEIFISGIGVGEGYLNNPELTKEVFLEDPFIPGNTMYKTGDLGKYRHDGKIEYVGRSDSQIKVRGFRVELGEIENIIKTVNDVNDVIVLAPKDDDADADSLGSSRGTVTSLIAYIIPSDKHVTPEQTTPEQTTPEQIRSEISKTLPAFMIPDAFVFMESFPLMSSGKVDRKALPQPEEVAFENDNFTAARNGHEEILVNIWEDILNKSPIGIHDDFFELGGHSLLAVQMISRIRNSLEVEVPVKTVFHNTTIAELASEISSLKSSEYSAPKISHISREEIIPLSFAQQRLWYIDQLDPGNTAYNMPFAVRLSGNIDYDALNKAFTTIVQRQESLRTIFHSSNGEAHQVILAPEKITIPIEDISQTNDIEEELLSVANKHATLSFDLYNGPLYSVKLIKISENDHAFLFNTHHIISDGWSKRLLLREMTVLYNTFVEGKPNPIPDLDVQYADFSSWQRNWLQGDVFDSQLDYWKHQLANAPTLLKLPTDRPRPKIQTTNGAAHTFRFSDTLTEKVKEFSRKNGITVFMTLLSAYKILLSKYSGQDDICVGIPVAGRDRTEIEKIIGFFINAVVIRSKLSDNPTINNFLGEIRKTTLDAYDHQHLPLEVILDALEIERNLSHSPLAQVGFSMQTAAPGEDRSALKGLTIGNIGTEHVTAKYDIILALTESAEEISGGIEFNTDLFDLSTIELLMSHYFNVVEQVIEEVESPINSIQLEKQEDLYQTLNISADNYDEIYPLSTIQRDLFLSLVMSPDTLENSLGYSMEIHNEVDIRLFEKSLQIIADSSDVLRTQIIKSNASYTDLAYQAIEANHKVRFEYEDLSTENTHDLKHHDLKHHDLKHHDLKELARDFIYKPYQLDKLVNYKLVKLKKDHYLFLFAACHIIFDGASGVTHQNLLAETYEKLVNGDSPNLETGVYKNFVALNRSKADSEETIKYWREKLNTTDVIEFVTANSSSENRSNHGAKITKSQLLTSKQWQDIRKFSRKHKITPQLFFKCIYGLLLKVYCSPETDFCISEIVAGRPKGHQTGMGCYFQQFPFIFPDELSSPDKSIEDLFTYSRNFQKEVREYKDISILTQKRLTPEGPVDFMFNFYSFDSKQKILGIEEPIEHFTPDTPGIVQFVIRVVDGLPQLNLHYHEGEFDHLDFLDRLLSLCEQVISGKEKIAELSFISEKEKDLILTQKTDDKSLVESLKDTNVSNNTINKTFEKAVELYPDNIAISFKETTLTYSELNSKANQVAHYLINEANIKPNQPIGLCLERDEQMLVAILGVLKAGGGYVPIDPNYPTDRISYTLSDSATPVVITTTKLQNELQLECDNILCLDSDNVDNGMDLSKYSTDNPNVSISPDDLAYIIYTSGSTGKPKGVQITHANVIRLFTSTDHWFGFNEKDAWTLFHSYAFDFSVWEIWGALLYGGKLVVVPYEISRSPDNFYKLLHTENVTVLNQTPSAFTQLIAAEENAIEKLELNLRYVIFGGEALQLKTLIPWFNRHGDKKPQLVNMYGITETTVHVTYRPISLDDIELTGSPIGEPIPDLKIYITNNHLQLLPPGVPGEMLVGGLGVARGYLNRPELNEERFINNPFSGSSENNSDDRLYRSGDLARYLPNGDIDYLGRIDNQVKIRGFRIELGEIESKLNDFPAISTSCVLVKSYSEDDKRIIAYLICNGEKPSVSDFRSYLSESLPDYMIPASFIFMDEFPLTGNGKINTKALPEPETSSAIDTNYVAPETDTEIKLVDIWQDILNIQQVGIDDNFFSLGGDSIISIRMISKANEAGINIEARQIFEFPTVRELANSADLLPAAPPETSNFDTEDSETSSSDDDWGDDFGWDDDDLSSIEDALDDL